MLTMTLVVNNRLHYLKQVIQSLQENDHSGFTLFIGAEPNNPHVVQFCRTIDFLPVDVTVNPTHLGVCLNPFTTLSKAFASGSTFNVALEDDVVLAPDALKLARWFQSLPYVDRYLALCFVNYGSTEAFPETICQTRHFAPLGWCSTVSMWKKYIASAWSRDPRGWDFSLNALLLENPQLTILQPKLSRSNHIGREGGTHCTPAHHDRIFAKLATSDGSRCSYQIEG